MLFQLKIFALTYLQMDAIIHNLKKYQKSSAEIEKKRLIIDCLLMLQEGTYPFIMKNRILGALSATERKKLEKGAEKNAE